MSWRKEDKNYANILLGWLTNDGEEPFSGKVDAGVKGTIGNPHFTSLATQAAGCETSYDTDRKGSRPGERIGRDHDP